MKLTNAILEKLADEEEFPDFVCPNCGGAFFSASPNEDLYECDTITDTYQCKWKGSGAACLVPARAALAKEILMLRRALSGALPHVAMATSITSGRDFKEAAEALLAEMRNLLDKKTP
jgi:predicted RNA-binding Zn-ribbon protein involved in translation (DUF1610 family)